jgi:hypothetical protein
MAIDGPTMDRDKPSVSGKPSFLSRAGPATDNSALGATSLPTNTDGSPDSCAEFAFNMRSTRVTLTIKDIATKSFGDLRIH